MLLYIREEDWDTIMCPVPESDVAEHLRNRVKVSRTLNTALGILSDTSLPSPQQKRTVVSGTVAAPCLLGPCDYNVGFQGWCAGTQAEAEAAAAKKRELEEAHRYTIIRVATNADFQKQIGSITYVDLVNFSQVRLAQAQEQSHRSGPDQFHACA